LISDFSKMNSFAYNSSYHPSLECFASNYDENEDIILKKLTKEVDDHENRTSIIEDTTLLYVGTLEESLDLKMAKSLTPDEPKDFASLLWEFINVFI